MSWSDRILAVLIRLNLQVWGAGNKVRTSPPPPETRPPHFLRQWRSGSRSAAKSETDEAVSAQFAHERMRKGAKELTYDCCKCAGVRTKRTHHANTGKEELSRNCLVAHECYSHGTSLRKLHSRWTCTAKS